MKTAGGAPQISQLNVRTPLKRIGAYLLNIVLFLATWPSRRLWKSATSSTDEVKKILIIRADQIGDVIMSTTILPPLRRRFPQARIDFLCGSWAYGIVRCLPLIDNVLVFDCPWWAPRGQRRRAWQRFVTGVIPFVRALRRTAYDVAIDLRGDLRHIYLFMYLPRAKRRISTDRSGGRFLLTDCASYDDGLHEMDKNQAVISTLGVPDHDRRPALFYSREKEGVAARLCESYGLTREGFIAVFNGGRSRLRHVPETTLAQCCSKLIEHHGLPVVLLGGPADHSVAERVKESISGSAPYLSDAVFNLCGMFDLMELPALLEYARIYIGTDSSVSHIAAAVGVPTLLLFGPTDPRLCAPYAARVIYHRYPCCPCLQTRCLVNGSRISAACMEAITAEEIVQSANTLLDENGNFIPPRGRPIPRQT